MTRRAKHITEKQTLKRNLCRELFSNPSLPCLLAFLLFLTFARLSQISTKHLEHHVHLQSSLSMMIQYVCKICIHVKCSCKTTQESKSNSCCCLTHATETRIQSELLLKRQKVDYVFKLIKTKATFRQIYLVSKHMQMQRSV